MRTAFLTHHDPLNSHSWSGILVYMLRSLERNCGEVVPLGPAGRSWLVAAKAAARLLRLAGQNVDATHTQFLAKAWAGIFERILAHADLGVIFVPVTSTELALREAS